MSLSLSEFAGIATAHQSMPEAEYHSMTEFVSNSMRKVARESLERYEAQYVTKTLPYQPPSRPQLFGASVHKLVLEGVASTVVQIPEEVLSKSGSRAGNAWKDFEASCTERGLTPLKRDEFKSLVDIHDAIMAHPLAQGCLFGAETSIERSIFWRDRDTELPMRCRIDVQSDGPGIISDLKALRDVSPEAFAKAARKFGYDSQQYLYTEAVHALTGHYYSFVFVCVETSPPYRVRCYELNEDFKAMAESDTRRDLERIANCYRTGIWREPGWGRIQTVAPPSFARYEKEWEYDDDGDGN